MKRSLACLLIPALLLQIASAPIGAANVGSEQGQSTFPTRKQALSRPRVVKMSGTSDAQLRVGSPRDKTTYDLRGFVSTAYREEVTSYPLSFGSQEATSGLAIIGGEVLGGNPRDWTWQQWEDMSEVGGALFIVADGPVVSYDLRADNVFDLFKPRPAGPDAKFMIDGAYGTYVRDDAIENDVEMSGTIRQSLFDGINSGVSIGQETGNPHAVTRIVDSVFVFRPMPNDRASDGLGHATMFKQMGEGRVVMRRDTICYTETPMDSDRLRIWMRGTYEDVTVVLGPDFVGRYPRPVPHGVTITRAWSVCDAAIARWHKRHPS
jgi:hypothetical protein